MNVAVFYYRYHDLQFLINFPLEANQGYGQKITNAPLARVTGGELELRLKPLPDLEIQAGLGIQNAKFVDLQLNLGGTPVSADGNKLFQAPDVSFNMALDWRFWHLANGDLRLHLDGNYFSNQFWDPRNVQRVEQPPYGIVNGRLALDLKTGLEIAAWTKNIASKRYSTYELAERNPIDGGFGEDQSIPGEPRTYGLELTYRF